MGILFRSVVGRRIVLCLFFVLTTAANAVSADDKTNAKETFERAVALFAKGDHHGALVAFEDSYSLYPRLSTLFNIGMCQKALLLYTEGAETFEQFRFSHYN